MKIMKRESAPRYIRDEGIVSYLLTSAITSQSKHITTTLVEIQPNGNQRVHSHEPEQIYFIMEGRGTMTVGDERERVEPGDCIFIPSGAPHGLENNGSEPIKYFSAAAPMFEPEQLRTYWPMKSESETSGG